MPGRGKVCGHHRSHVTKTDKADFGLYRCGTRGGAASETEGSLRREGLVLRIHCQVSLFRVDDLHDPGCSNEWSPHELADRDAEDE